MTCNCNGDCKTTWDATGDTTGPADPATTAMETLGRMEQDIQHLSKGMRKLEHLLDALLRNVKSEKTSAPNS